MYFKSKVYMMMVHVVLFLSVFPFFVFGVSVEEKCPDNELVMYKMTVTAMWDRRDFPKQYPDWRPSAHWSKVIGLSHDHSLDLYKPGELSSDALKQFAENGDSTKLDLLTQGSAGVLDSFRTAPIMQGVGKAESQFFVNGNHSKVSLVSKIVPSPDWFIGVNGYDLCASGHWVDTVNIQLEPLDSGTDKGLTFTSPTWPCNPPERIHTITAHYPDHPAGSFYYPTLDHLPPIAKVTFSKEKEYGLRLRFDAADASLNDIYSIDEITIQNHDGSFANKDPQVSYYTTNEENDKKAPKSLYSSRISSKFVSLLPEKDKHDIDNVPKAPNHPWLPHQRHHSKHHTTSGLIMPEGVTEPGIHFEPAKNEIITEENEIQEEASTIKGNGKKKIPTGNAMAVFDNIVKNYQKDRRRKIKKKKREERQRRRLEMKKIRPPRDCRVSEWSSWSPCSKTCGIGEQTRPRTILKHARRGGKVCPSLKETTWCGSARDCNRSYFNWS